MKNKIIIMTVIVMVGVAGAGCKDKKECTNLKGNPFMEEWNTPYGVPPFDKIKVEHYMPAFNEGIRQQKEEIKAICDNKETPTFGNTIIPLEYSGELLNKVSSVFMNLLECCDSPEMDKVADEVTPKLSQNEDDIMLNKECLPVLRPFMTIALKRS